MSAACKYLASSQEIDDACHETKTLGYFSTESDLVEKIRQETGTGKHRNPITYIVEACDDIVYSVVDLEDGVKKGVIGWEEMVNLVRKEMDADASILDDCEKLSKDLIDRSKKYDIELTGKNQDEAFVQAFRVFYIGKLADSVIRAFQSNYQDMISGQYHGELYKDCDASGLIKACKAIGKKYVYQSTETLKLEIMGYRVIHDLMALFWRGASEKGKDTKNFENKIYKLMSSNYREIFKRTIEDKAQRYPADYCRLQLVTDYICGMTDTYACSLHKDLTHG